ncbi:MAG: Uma2 family endonuclease [Jaaginema sp. PMC 1079.18]|nr:Uma2 family endonuclease [Jaaginema sp. PMC 1080.18]MEC4853581.1 Uma2 family endonuclease [Jaaginema sp. PMC 1079.18]MEC4868085.1 Uma2 family endonuclease [Jaaginema sp. PMC 1078.18]
MVTPTQEQKHYSLEEYFELEINAEIRHEYLNGEIIPMTGGIPEHNEIASILNAILRLGLKGQSYSIFIADQRLWIPETRMHTYPDVMVASRPLQRQSGRNDTITNPVLVAEVLSNSTKAYDRGDKFAAYRTVPTLQEYLLVDQYRLHLEQFTKTASNQWLFTEYNDPEALISLVSVSLEFNLQDLYEGLGIAE